VPLYALYELGILLLVVAPARRVAHGRFFSSEEDANDSSASLYEQEDEDDPRFRS